MGGLDENMEGIIYILNDECKQEETVGKGDSSPIPVARSCYLNRLCFYGVKI